MDKGALWRIVELGRLVIFFDQQEEVMRGVVM
jgi:hypothetical protein